MESVSAPTTWRDALSKVGTIVGSLSDDSLASKLDKGSLALPQISGVEDTTYFSLLDKSTKLPAFNIVDNIKCFPMPQEIRQHLESAKSDNVFTSSGFIVEHKKAWVSIENTLYFWDFETGSGVLSFDMLEQLIMDIIVVRKSEDIFGVKENYLLFISTPTMIYLFPLSVNANGNAISNSFEYLINNDLLAETKCDGVDGFIKFKDDKICCKSFEGVLYDLKTITNKGIILKISLNPLSESSLLKYLPSLSKIFGFTSSRIKETFQDDSRNILYALYDDNSIKSHMFDAKKSKFVSSSTLTCSSIISSIVKVYNNFKESDFGDLIGYDVIDINISQKIQLKLFTTSGIRLYFSSSKSNMAQLIIHHVRFPPIYQELSSFYVHKGFSIDGTSIMIMKSDTDPQLRLIATTDEVFNPQSSINEIHQNSMCPIPFIDTQSLWSSAIINVTENYSDSMKLILTESGVYSISKSSKQSIFGHLLSKYGSTAEETLSFVLLTGPVYACMIAIEMIGLYDSLSHNLTQFIHSIGQSSNMKNNFNQQSVFPSILDNTLVSSTGAIADSKYIPFKNIINSTNALNQFSNSVPGSSTFSTLLTSLYTSVSILLKPLWNSKFFKTEQAATNVGSKMLLQLYHDTESLQQINATLKRIQMFMRDHAKTLFFGSELHSVINLMVFNELLTEIFSLIEITGMFPAHRAFPEKHWTHLCDQTLISILVDYESFTALIIEHILLYYISNEADINSLNNLLTQSCPQLFKESDAMFSRATQSLALANECIDGKQKYISEAYEIYRSIIDHINVSQACFNLLKCQAFNEIAQICFLKAKSVDNENMHHEIYSIFIDTLLFLHQVMKGNTVDPSLSQHFRDYSKDDASRDFLNLLRIGLAVENRLLHFKIYTFLHSLNEVKLFIQINSPYINEFISQLISSQIEESDTIEPSVATLASEFYQSRKMFFQSACMMYHLVNSQETDLKEKMLTLDNISLLLKAVPQSKITTNISQFIDQINDDIDTCNVQMKILQNIKNLNCDQNLQITLNSKLFSLQDLLLEFAHPFDMFDIKLEIVKLSTKPVEKSVIESIWSNFIAIELQNYSKSNKYFSTLIDSIKQFSKEASEFFPLTHIILSFLHEIANNVLDIFDIFSTLLQECPNLNTQSLLLSLKSLVAAAASEISLQDLILAFECVCAKRRSDLSSMMYVVEDFIADIRQYIDANDSSSLRMLNNLQEICA